MLVPQRMMYLMVGCLCFGVLLILLNIYQLRSLNAGMTVGDPEFGSSRRPIVWINGKNVRMLLDFCIAGRISFVNYNRIFLTLEIGSSPLEIKWIIHFYVTEPTLSC